MDPRSITLRASLTLALLAGCGDRQAAGPRVARPTTAEPGPGPSNQASPEASPPPSAPIPALLGGGERVHRRRDRPRRGLDLGRLTGRRARRLVVRGRRALASRGKQGSLWSPPPVPPAMPKKKPAVDKERCDEDPEACGTLTAIPASPLWLVQTANSRGDY